MCRNSAEYLVVTLTLLVLTITIRSGFLYDDDNVRSVVDLTHALDFEIVRPRIIDGVVRRRRDINSNVYYEEENKLKIVELGDWVLELNINHNLLLPPQLAGEWVSGDSTVYQRLKQCDYKQGLVQGLGTTSTVAMAVCGSEITGFVLIPGAAYFIQPFDRSNGSHIIYKSKIFKPPFRIKRAASVIDELNETTQKWEFFNLTGDTIEIDELDSEITEEDDEVSDNGDVPDKLPLGNDSLKWWREQVDSEEIGYFFDTAWEADIKSTVQ